MPDIPKKNSRKLAAQIIENWLKTDVFAEQLIKPDMPDRPFVMEMIYGIVKRRRTIQWIVEHCAERTPDDTTMPYLLVGIYQIMFMDNVAEYAAVNETVEAVKTGNAPSCAGFVNAILRRVLREKESIKNRLAGQPLGIRESHSDALITRWTKNFGSQKTADLCRWNNLRGDVVLRINANRTCMKDFLAALASGGINAVPHGFMPDFFAVLPGGTPIMNLPGYKDGLFSVQDPSTQVSVDMLDPQPGDCVLDACAAPGGKTCIIAEKMRGKGTLIAGDLQKDRVARLKENIARLKLDCISVRHGDASTRAGMKSICGDTRFDRILLDVPCTNTGVLRRRADARWSFSMEKLAQLTSYQRAILDSASAFLKPGGTLVYSTCSIEPDENYQLVDTWLEKNPLFVKKKDCRLFPPDTQTDGVYACQLIRS